MLFEKKRSFSCGSAAGFSIYKLLKVFDAADKVFARRKLEFSKAEKDILAYVYDMTKRYRNES